MKQDIKILFATSIGLISTLGLFFLKKKYDSSNHRKDHLQQDEHGLFDNWCDYDDQHGIELHALK